MPTNTPKQTLKIYLLDISPHNQAILEFFFSGAGRQDFQIVDLEDEATAFLTDFDYPGAQQRWESDYAGLNKPSIILAMTDPALDNCTWVPKPITSKNMVGASHAITGLSTNSGSGLSKVAMQTKVEPTPPDRHMQNYKPGKMAVESPFSAGSRSSSPAVRRHSQEQQDIPVLIEEKVEEKEKSAPNEPETKVSKEEKATTEKAKPVPEIAIKLESDEDAKKAQERWSHLCGNNTADDTSSYNRENHLEGSIIAALRLAKQTRKVIQIKYEPHQFHMLYDEYVVISDIDPKSDDYQELCTTNVMPGQINLHILNSTESDSMKRKVAALKIEGNKSTLYSLESFIWTTCLLSSRGNLSIDCNKDKLYLLKAWPDFARIEHFPFVMKIAARWHYEPCTLSDLSKDMDVPQHYINSFFNGASGLSLFEDDQAKIAAQKKVKPRKKMGIIARLFSRLTIGGKNST